MEGKFRIHLFTDEELRVDCPPDSLLRSLYDENAAHRFSSAIDIEAQLLTTFLEAGLDRLHLRHPHMSVEVMENLIASIPERFHPQIILHDFPELALKYGCGFQLNSRHPDFFAACPDCHIPPKDSSFANGSAPGFAPASLSKSCHSLNEAGECVGLDFVTLSPVFDSISKSGYVSAFRDEDLAASDLSKVVALGGVTLESLPHLEALGFGGAALLGDVWHRSDGASRLVKYLKMRNFALQFITDAPTPEETVAQSVEFLKGGGRWVQVRMKDAEKQMVAEVLEKLSPICRSYGATLIVDDHYDLTEFCDGVHLGQEDTPVSVVRSKIAPEKIIGLTVNTQQQIEASRKLPDYYGVGPFRFTSTKKRLAPVLGIEGYRRLAPLMDVPFVAIGGIRLDDVAEIIKSGASGIAVSSLITRSEDPATMTARLLESIGK